MRIIHVCVEARLGMMKSVSRFSKPMDPEILLMKPDLNPVNPHCCRALLFRRDPETLHCAGLPDFLCFLRETITDAPYRLNVPGEIAEFFTQVLDVCIHCALRNHHGVLPDCFE